MIFLFVNKISWICFQQGEEQTWERKATYIDTLLKDSGFEDENEIKTAMLEREGWKRRIHGARSR